MPPASHNNPEQHILPTTPPERVLTPESVADVFSELELTPTARTTGAALVKDDTPTKSTARGTSASHSLQTGQPTRSTKPWQETYKNMYDLLTCTSMPQTPPIYERDKLASTKSMTKAEFDIAEDDELMYLVHLPSMLDPAEVIAKEMLSATPVDWKNRSNVIFSSHCLPYVPSRLLPQVIASEGDVGPWCDSTILRPALAAFRACQAKHVVAQLAEHPPHPSLSSAPNEHIIPDRVLLKDVQFLDVNEARQQQLAEVERLRAASQERDRVRVASGFKPLDRKFPEKAKDGKRPIAKQIPLLTVELKTHHVWQTTLFKNLFSMPDLGTAGQSHTMRFAWPASWHEGGDEDKLDKETRIIIQVWCQMVQQKINYGMLSSHQNTVFLIRRGKALYFSRKYAFSRTPQLSAFCHLLLAAETVKYTEKELPSPNVPKEWATLYSREKLWSSGTIGLVSGTVWRDISGRPQRGKAAAQAQVQVQPGADESDDDEE